MAQNSGLLTQTVIQLSENKFAVFPWVGTRQLYTLHFCCCSAGSRAGCCGGPACTWRLRCGPEFPRVGAYIETVIREILASRPDLFSLPLPDKVQIGHKYNEFVPPELLKKEFVLDFLDFDGLRAGLSFSE